jgi:hypothetical protein
LPVNLSYFSKEIVPANHNFQGGERLILFQTGNSAELKKHMYLSLEKHLCQMLQILAHCFHVRIDLVFERNPFLQLRI